MIVKNLEKRLIFSLPASLSPLNCLLGLMTSLWHCTCVIPWCWNASFFIFKTVNSLSVSHSVCGTCCNGKSRAEILPSPFLLQVLSLTGMSVLLSLSYWMQRKTRWTPSLSWPAPVPWPSTSLTHGPALPWTKSPRTRPSSWTSLHTPSGTCSGGLFSREAKRGLLTSYDAHSMTSYDAHSMP